MKRLFSVILCLCMFVSLCACGGNTAEPVETTKPAAPKEKTNVAEPLTWEKINAIPIANDSMTEEQLRQICIDTFRLQLTFGWTPSESTDYNSGMSDKTFYKGQVYGGPPYQSVLATFTNGCISMTKKTACWIFPVARIHWRRSATSVPAVLSPAGVVLSTL